MAARKKKAESPEYLTVAQAAEVIGIDQSQVRRHCISKALPCIQVSDRVRLIRPADAAEFAKIARKPGRKAAKK